MDNIGNYSFGRLWLTRNILPYFYSYISFIFYFVVVSSFLINHWNRPTNRCLNHEKFYWIFQKFYGRDKKLFILFYKWFIRCLINFSGVDAFKPDNVSETVLLRLLKHDIIFHIKMKDREKMKVDASCIIYQQVNVESFWLLLFPRDTHNYV